MPKTYKLVIFVPETHADTVREAVGKAGAGKIGNYGFCSFSLKGTGCFKPLEGAKPAIGDVGKFEEAAEERVEVNCPDDKLKDIIAALTEAHPYEEPAFDLYELVDYASL